MIEQTAEPSPRMKARIAGVFYLLTILISVFALVAHGALRSVLLLRCRRQLSVQYLASLRRASSWRCYSCCIWL